MTNLTHLSFQTFKFNGFNLSGLYDKGLNRLYYTKGFGKRMYKALLSGKTTNLEIGGAYLSLNHDDVTYVGPSEELTAKFA